MQDYDKNPVSDKCVVDLTADTYWCVSLRTGVHLKPGEALILITILPTIRTCPEDSESLQLLPADMGPNVHARQVPQRAFLQNFCTKYSLSASLCSVDRKPSN